MNGFQENAKSESVLNAKALIGIDAGDHEQYKEIKLTQGKVALVDDEDFEWLNQWKWCLKKSAGGLLYAARFIKRKTIFMHREIMKTPEGLKTDHRNGNGLDNRRDNLRKCTHAQNLMNQKIRRNNSSGYKGVGREGEKWRARIRINGKYISIGSFFFKEDAAAAYNRAAQKYHGEFARPNSIDYHILADIQILGNR